MIYGENNPEYKAKIYGEERKDLLARQLSNSINCDNAILTLSSASLGLSLTFIKNIVPIERIDCRYLLFSSWGLFGLAIIVIIASFSASQKAITVQLEYAYQAYMKGKSEYLTKKNTWAIWTDRLNILSGVSFMLGVVITIYFVVINTGESRMKNKEQNAKDTSISKKQSIEIKKGAPVNALQPSAPRKDSTGSKQSGEPQSNQTNKK